MGSRVIAVACGSSVEPVHQLVGKDEAMLLPFRFVHNLTIPHEHKAAVAQVRGMDAPLMNLGSMQFQEY